MRKDLSVTVDAWGNIIVAGPVAEGAAMSFVAKLDKDGNLLWHETLRHDVLTASAAGSVPPPAPDRDSLLGRDSVDPVALDAELEVYQRQLGRRSRVARWIGAALAFAGLFVVGAMGGAMAGRMHAASMGSPTFARSGVDVAVDERVDHAMASGIGAGPVGMVQDDEPVVVDQNEEEPEPLHGEPLDVETVPLVHDDAAVLPLDEPVFDDVVRLRAEVLALLNEGRFEEAVRVGERLVAADRQNAFNYLCLGAALQDLGRGEHARANYDACVRNATRGDVSECMALGGRR